MAEVTLAPEEGEAIAQRAAEIVLARLAERDNGRWLHGARAVSEYTGLPTSTVFKLTSRGEIPCRRVGERLLFDRRELDEWLRNGGA